jgi:Rieske Fe-S protein
MEGKMGDLTRRRFIVRTTLGVGAVMAGAATTAAAAGAQHLAPAATEEHLGSLDASDLSDAIVVHVRDAGKGELSLMTGTDEIVCRDRQLVARLLAAARRAGKD